MWCELEKGHLIDLIAGTCQLCILIVDHVNSLILMRESHLVIMKGRFSAQVFLFNFIEAI